ncbi:hypothetical protein [Nocardia wallacei]|uniref:hypothetical protein n=1 Tax=Nocardia wallacei TaxID=480035 RepID=UPI00245582A4|nr:hypothetical protein [Nocardia wallacei]
MYIGEPDELRGSAKTTGDRLDVLEGLLKNLTGVQDELRAAVVSKGAGDAIYNTVGNAHERGKSLAGTLAKIISDLNQAGVKVESDDLAGAQQILKAEALEAQPGYQAGEDWTGGRGSWSDGAMSQTNTKVDTNSW